MSIPAPSFSYTELIFFVLEREKFPDQNMNLSLAVNCTISIVLKMAQMNSTCYVS